MNSVGGPLNDSLESDGVGDTTVPVPSAFDEQVDDKRGDSEQVSQGLTVGEHLVRAVVPSTALPSMSEWDSSPLPVVDVVALYRDASVLYSMGRVDQSGRVSERSVVDRLAWSPGDRLHANLVSGMVFFQRDPRGSLALTSRSYVPIPSSIQTQCGLHAGDRVLLAPVPDHDLVVAYTPLALDAMTRQYCESLIEGASR